VVRIAFLAGLFHRTPEKGLKRSADLPAWFYRTPPHHTAIFNLIFHTFMPLPLLLKRNGGVGLL